MDTTTVATGSRQKIVLTLIRLAWIIIVPVILLYLVYGLAPLYTYYALPCEVDTSDFCWSIDYGLNLFGLNWEIWAAFRTASLVVVCVFYISLGILMAVRRPRDPKGLLFSLTLVVSVPLSFDSNLADVLTLFYPAMEMPVYLLVVVAQLCMLAFLFFPDWHFQPGWMRWVAILFPVLMILWMGLFSTGAAFELSEAGAVFGAVLWNGFPILVAYSLFFRYRWASNPEQRQQIKWIALAMALVAAALTAYAISDLLLPYTTESPLLYALQAVYSAYGWPISYTLSILFLAFAFFLAIFRYRLWDVDFLINRSLVYGALTLVLALIFLATLPAAFAAIQSVTGSDQSLVSAAIAAAAAGLLFQPIRRRFLRWIDSRLYHIRIDYQKASTSQQETLPVSGTNAVPVTGFRNFTGLILIGKGGMAEVYRATHPDTRMPVAIKFLTARHEHDPSFGLRFDREVDILRKLDHPNIVRVLEGGVEAGRHYMILEYLEGVNLSLMLKGSGPLTLDRALPILAALANALDYAHAHGLVHRDVKPANVMLTPAGGGRDRVVLMDFGIAKVLDAASDLTQSMFLGTLDYIAPEQIQAAADVDRRADVYSLGVLAFELLAGHRPFRHNNAGALLMAHLLEPPPDVRLSASALPASVAAALRRAMAKNPADRFETAGQFVGELLLAPIPAVSSPGLQPVFTG